MAVIRRPARTTPLDLTVLQREVNQLLERLADFDRPAAAEGEWVPGVDVYECRGKIVIAIEVPGTPLDSLRVSFRDRHLTVTGERRERRPAAAAASFHCMERPQGRFTRTVLIDIAVNIREAEATLAGGVLTIAIPRVKDQRGREIVIPVKRQEEAS
jgi:HSP20 family molecular chaperone IbpA